MILYSNFLLQMGYKIYTTVEPLYKLENDFKLFAIYRAASGCNLCVYMQA